MGSFKQSFFEEPFSYSKTASGRSPPGPETSDPGASSGSPSARCMSSSHRVLLSICRSIRFICRILMGSGGTASEPSKLGTADPPILSWRAGRCLRGAYHLIIYWRSGGVRRFERRAATVSVFRTVGVSAKDKPACRGTACRTLGRFNEGHAAQTLRFL